MTAVNLRKAETQADHDFILSYWLNYYRNNSKFAREVAPTIYFKEHKKRAITAIKHGTALILSDPKEESMFLGFLVGINAKHLGQDVLHMVYVKEPFRNFGLGHLMMKKFKSEARHLVITHQGNILGLKNHYETIAYNPYLFFKLPTE